MTESLNHLKNADRRKPRSFWAVLIRWPLCVGLLAPVCLVTLFYAEENWRGYRAWERCRRDLGGPVDLGISIQPAIPNVLNVLQAPGLVEWFVDRPTPEFLARANPVCSSTNPIDSVLADVTVVCGTNQPDSPQSALCLDYDAPVIELADMAKARPNPAVGSRVIPLIVMDSVPLLDAIKNLARQDGRSYLVDSNLVWSLNPPPPSLFRQPWRWIQERIPGRTPYQPPTVNIRWENVTAFQALQALLVNYNLAWTEDPTNHVGHVSIRPESYSMVQFNPKALQQLQLALTPFADHSGSVVRFLTASSGFILFHSDDASPGTGRRPAQVILRSSSVPTSREVELLFTSETMPWFPPSLAVRAVTTGTNSFRVMSGLPCFCRAERYLAQTDSLETDFKLMRQALQRPYARFESASSLRDYVGVRVVTQILAQRAQAHLLTGRPEAALEDLTLIHQLTKIIEAEPFSFVAPLVECAVTDTYVSVIQDGLRLGAWQEPQLIAFQAQLAGINLMTLMSRGVSNECHSVCETIETNTPAGFGATFEPGIPRRTLLEKMRIPGFSILGLGPRGWRYSSMAAVSSVYRRSLSNSNPTTRTLQAREIDRLDSVAAGMRRSNWPPARLAGIATHRLAWRYQVAAHRQSLANLALVACSLERYRIARGEYPLRLAQLVPAFVKSLPVDIIGGTELRYQRLDSAHFKLYSVGWNEIDEGGLVSKARHPSDYSVGDWVWN